MKKVTLLLFLLGIVLLSSASLYAEGTNDNTPDRSQTLVDTNELRYTNSPVNKLGRGAINAATCWMEIPANVCRVSADTDNPFLGYTLGLGEGLITTVVRGVTGIFDMVTFALPPYNKPVMQPEYAMDSLSEGFDDNVEAQIRPE